MDDTDGRFQIRVSLVTLGPHDRMSVRDGLEYCPIGLTNGAVQIPAYQATSGMDLAMLVKHPGNIVRVQYGAIRIGFFIEECGWLVSYVGHRQLDVATKVLSIERVEPTQTTS